ncbi:MAG: ferritin-like domain-containing protein [Fimbriiglobus sp.]|jgi:bacterioferritin|nr:ferritin-like domain-containing protein [Fimbriiglobus sp.]
MAAKQQIIDALIEAYNKELETILNYLSCSIDIDGVRAEAIKNALAGDIQGEIEHARQIGARVRQLGGTVLGSMALEMEQSYLQPPADTTDVVTVIRGVLAAEEEAIRTYNEIIKLCEGNDYVTQDLAIRILGDEEGHRQQFDGYLKEYTKK